MYFEDLTPYTYNPLLFDGAVNVGWLAGGHPFDTGPSPRTLFLRLCIRARRPLNPGKRVHTCDICCSTALSARGQGEIHVYSLDGTVYVAPALIVHYIGAHCYCPPQKFVDAVLAAGLDGREAKYETLVNRLMYLASESDQMRFCVYGTHGNYLVADHILLRFLFALNEILSNPDGREWLDRIAGSSATSHIMAIQTLWIRNQGFLDDYCFDTIDDLILRDPVWVEMRNHAKAALSSVGYDLGKHEAEKLRRD